MKRNCRFQFPFLTLINFLSLSCAVAFWPSAFCVNCRAVVSETCLSATHVFTTQLVKKNTQSERAGPWVQVRRKPPPPRPQPPTSPCSSSPGLTLSSGRAGRDLWGSRICLLWDRRWAFSVLGCNKEKYDNTKGCIHFRRRMSLKERPRKSQLWDTETCN